VIKSCYVDGIWSNYRLPDYIIPAHYRLKLHPNMTTDTYTGSNAMTFKVTKARINEIFGYY